MGAFSRFVLLCLFSLNTACAFEGLYGPHPPGPRTIQYTGVELLIYVTQDLPTNVLFPSTIDSHLWDSEGLNKSKNGSTLMLYPWAGFPREGDHFEIKLVDGRRYQLWVVPATGGRSADTVVRVLDSRSASEIRREEKSRWK